MRAAMLESCRRTTSTTVPAIPPLPSTKHLAGGHLRAGLGGIDAVFLAGIAADDAGDGRPVTATEESLHALRRGAGGIEDGQLDPLADFLADAGGETFDGLLDGVGAIHPLGRHGREFLRALARRQCRPELEPARLVAHLADRLIDLPVDDVVEIPTAPFVGNDGPVVEVGEAGLQALEGQRLDGPAKALLVAGLACFVFRPRDRRRRHAPLDTCATSNAAAVKQETADRKKWNGLAHESARLSLVPPARPATPAYRVSARDLLTSEPKHTKRAKSGRAACRFRNLGLRPRGVLLPGRSGMNVAACA